MPDGNFSSNENLQTLQLSKTVQNTHHLVETLLRKIFSERGDGFYFFRSDTGTGKTTGVIHALKNFPDKRIAIAVPTTEDAQSIYEQIVGLLGADDVGVWSRDHEEGKHGEPVDRREQSEKRIFVGTHNFLLGAKDPTKHVGERDLLIVDEIPQTMAVATLSPSDFAKAREQANRLNLSCREDFTTVARWAEEEQTKAEEVSQADFRTVPLQKKSNLPSALEEVGALRVRERKELQPILDFFVAARAGRGFQRIERTGLGHGLKFVSFGEPASWFPKQLILSATPHLDGYQHSPHSTNIYKDKGALVRYDNLTIHSAPWPCLPKMPREIFGSNSVLFLAVDHMRELIRRTVTDKVLLVVPKELRTHIRKSLDEQSVGTKEVKVTNWGRDVGSNEYRECGDVILWGNHHKPKHATVAEWFVYSQYRITPELLAEHAGKGKLNPKTTEDLQQGQLYAQIKQMGCRGTARFVDENGVCHPMHLWICWDGLDPLKLDRIFPGHSFEPETGFPEKFASSTSDTIKRLLYVLGDSWDNELIYNDLAGPMGVDLKTLQNRTADFLREQPRLEKHGWRFVPGGKGRGKRSKFVRLKPI